MKRSAVERYENFYGQSSVQICARYRTVDTDVVVLAVSRVHDFSVDEIWIAIGTGKHFRYLPIHSILNNWDQKEAGLFRCSTQSLDATQYLSFPEGEKHLPGTSGTCFHKSQIPFQCWLQFQKRFLSRHCANSEIHSASL